MAPYQKELFIPLFWSDSIGIVFYGHNFSIAHQAFESFLLDRLQLSWESWFQNPDWIVPIRDTQASYQAPLLPGKPCQVHLQIGEIKTSSFSIHYDLYQNNVKCTTLKTVHVFCSRTTGQKQSIPSQILPLLQSNI